MNHFTFSLQTNTSERCGLHNNTFKLRRLGKGLMALVAGVVLAFSAPQDAYAQCTNTPSGQYPFLPFSPVCNGSAQSIVTDAWTGEYSAVNVASGTEYTFGSSVSTHFITIYGTDGSTIYASGANPVVWTATLTGTVRFATHLDAACGVGVQDDHARTVTCSSASNPNCAAVPAPCVDIESLAYEDVILNDAFCCDTQWDNVCQDAYNLLSTTCLPTNGPANDLCANAIAVACGDVVTGTTVDATTDLSESTFCGISVTAPGVWYLLQGTAAGDVVTASLCGTTAYDSKISVFSGSCGALSCVGGNDDACGLVSETSFISDGTDRYILVHGFGGLTGAFQLTITCVTPPPAAWCASAGTIGCDASVSGSTVGGPNDNVPGTCVVNGNTSPKRAYFYTGIGEDVVVNTFGSGFDTKLWVYAYNGSCQPGDLVCVGGNDDTNGLQSQVSFFGEAGQDYLFIVGGFGSGNQGAFTLNTLCGPFGCTDPAACNYDEANNNDDGSCFYVCNDQPSGAIALATTPLGTCSPLAQDMNDATTNFGGFLFGFGNDLWYSFTAVTSGVRVEVSTSTVDAMVEVRDAATNSLVEFEDALFVNGSEILNFGGLTAGEEYLIRVADYNSGSTSRPFDICVQFLPDTQCDLNVGVTSIERSLCQNAKADWVAGANNYTFHFTPVGGGSTITYETGAAFTIAPLQNVPGLLWGTTYTVEIDLALTLTNSAGTSEAITVLGSNACELVIVDAPTAALRSSDNLANAGPLPLGAYVAATPWVCTAIEWEWVFSNTNGSQLPIVHLSGTPSRFIRLSDVSGLNAGDVYNVQVRPVFATGYEGAFGATEQIAIIGALGMVEDVTSPVANTEIDERVEATIIEAGVALYPNPNRGDFVNVNIANVAEGVDRVIFDLYDLTGKRVISEQIAVAGSGVNVVMPLNGLADGMYIANIIIGDEVHTERIAVQK